MLFVQEVNIYVTGGFLGLYILFVIIVVWQSSSSNKDTEEDELDQLKAQQAIDFTDMIHQKRDEAASQYSQRKKSIKSKDQGEENSAL